MIYNTGTIAINGNTATGTGTSWTAPASHVRAGQTIIVMSNPVQMFQISSVNSATSMTVTPAASPALSGQKYGILVSDIISVDGLAQAMSQLIKEYDENIVAWETFAATSANQSITVTINGSSITIPGIGKLAQKASNGAIAVKDGGTGATSVEDALKNLGLDNVATKSGGAVPVSQGGTGSTSAQGARTNLGLGTVATYTVATSTSDWNANRVLYTGCWGIGAQDCPTISDANAARQGGIVQGGGGIGTNWVDPYCPALVMNRSERMFSQIQVTSANRMVWRIGEGGVGWKPWLTAWDSGNTTVDSSGSIKKASPIIKIYSDGHFDINEESKGCTVTRLAVGEYLIEGCTGMNSDASWGGIDGGFDIPQDRNKQPLIWLDYEVSADGSILVKTYHRTHQTAPAFARNELQGVKDGDPVDIPADQFLSARVEMPVTSDPSINYQIEHPM
ncbi:phage tail fiber protein [Kluyvera intermedia]|uniref:phage tail fiber protein n=1 Tax=Kluyvera intermedia TaxID=61648 RepID=UPI00370CBD0B